jgi:hypothetical protein
MRPFALKFMNVEAGAVVGKLNPEESIKRVEQLKNTPREVLA